MIRSRVDEKDWVRCGKCGRKLMRIVEKSNGSSTPTLEIKCGSCKEINVWWYEFHGKEAKK